MKIRITSDSSTLGFVVEAESAEERAVLDLFVNSNRENKYDFRIGGWTIGDRNGRNHDGVSSFNFGWQPKKVDETKGFKVELAGLINKYSLESGNDTPDVILADYLIGCLGIYEETIRNRHMLSMRERWNENQ